MLISVRSIQGIRLYAWTNPPKQLIAETKVPIPVSPGRPAKHDYGYRRCGVCNVFLACEPLVGKRMVTVSERKTKRDWAYFMEEIPGQYESAEKLYW